MKFNWKYAVILIVIISFSALLRFYQIEDIPAGLNIDESSQGYNAFSLLKTGKDRYGQSFPIIFRSFGSYQTPLYTYLTTVPIYFFGNSIVAVRLISVLSGIMLTLITFFLILNFKHKNITLAVISALIVAASPWAVFFSRIGTEANLGISLFTLSFLIFYLSLKRCRLFPIAAFILGLSTHAYYSERLISVIFFIGFILLFRKIFFQKKKYLILGLILFGLTQMPHLLIISSGAFTRRIDQVNYLNEQLFRANSGALYYVPFGKTIFVTREFLSQYFSYFSPRNLFFDPDPQQERSIPDLSVFYNWMIVPLFFGFINLFRNRFELLIKMMLLVIIIAPIPAALTRDPFYTIRTLVLLWMLTIVISLGFNDILSRISKPFIKCLLILFLVLYSAVVLYVAYFILLKYERQIFDYAYIRLLEKTQTMSDQTFIVDSSRQLANGIRFAFLKEYDPVALQKVLSQQIKDEYYSDIEFDEPYSLDNIEARPIIWEEDIYKEQILIGDLLAISDSQIEEHHLKFLFDVEDKAGNVALKAYMTDPKAKCNSIRFSREKYRVSCQKYL